MIIGNGPAHWLLDIILCRAVSLVKQFILATVENNVTIIIENSRTEKTLDIHVTHL